MNKLELKILFSTNMSKHTRMSNTTLHKYIKFLSTYPDTIEDVQSMLSSLVAIKDYRHLFPKTGIKITYGSLDHSPQLRVIQARVSPFDIKVTVSLNKEIK